MRVFPDPHVVAATRSTVNVRLEQTWFRDLARQYDVRTVPTFVLTDAAGVEQIRLTGVPTAQEFASWLTGALNQAASRPAATRSGATPRQPAPEPAGGAESPPALAPASPPVMPAEPPRVLTPRTFPPAAPPPDTEPASD
jgi:hypothetical protein